MVKRFVSAVLVVVLAYVGVVFICGSTAWLHVDFPSLLMVPVLPLLYMAVLYGFPGMAAAFRAPFSPASGARELGLSLAFFRDLGRSFWLFGSMGMCLGLIEVLRNLTDRSKIGPNLAITILTALYAAVFNLLLAHPFAAQARRRLAESE